MKAGEPGRVCVEEGHFSCRPSRWGGLWKSSGDLQLVRELDRPSGFRRPEPIFARPIRKTFRRQNVRLFQHPALSSGSDAS